MNTLSNMLASDDDLLTAYPVIQRGYNQADRDYLPGMEPVCDRVQITTRDKTHMMLVRHVKHHHWCGYVQVDFAEWQLIQKEVRKSFTAISYVDFSNRYIMWMDRAGNNKLVRPVQLSDPTKHDKGDHWVGFTTLIHGQPYGETINEAACTQVLYNLATAIREARFDRTRR